MNQVAVPGSAAVPWIDRTSTVTRARRASGSVSATEDSLAVHLEKVPGHGEDAPPAHFGDATGRIHVLAVCDGLGGAGAARRTVAGAEHTEAFLAARLARTVVHRAGVHGRAIDGAQLARWLEVAFAAFDQRHPASGASRIKSSLARALPTTIAVACTSPEGSGHRVDALWAGDSRVFLLRPSHGLQQISVDHVRDPDPLQQLLNDSPLVNVVSRSHEFTLDHASLAVEGAFVVLVATDGVFGYVRTPGEVEHHLLDTMANAKDMDDWSDLLVERISGYTGDDASLALAAVGFAGFADLSARFARRRDVVRADQVDPLDAAGSPDELRRARSASWDRYAPGYHEVRATTLAGADPPGTRPAQR